MPDEKPTMEEPEKKPAQETEKVDVEGLMKELDAANIKSSTQLAGRLKNAQDFDRMQSERDMMANELAEVRTEIAEIKKVSSTGNYTDENFGEPVDLDTALDKALERRDRKKQKQAMDFQMKMASVWKNITSHPQYPLVEKRFQKEIVNDPMTPLRIQTGELNPEMEFQKMLTEHAFDLAARSSEAFKEMTSAGKVAPPHVESGARAPEKQEVESDKDKKINELRKKAGSSSGLRDDEMDDLLDSQLGDIFGRL